MISSIILLIGLAVGVDYTLFYLRREREEKAAGRQDARRVAHRRRDLRPRRPRLRLHRHGRDGGHAARRRPHVHLARHRRDHGRRRRDDRLAHRGAGDARLARRPRRQGPGAVPAPPQARRRREPHVERRADPRPQAPGAVRRPGRAVLVALAIPAFSMHTVQTGTDDLPRKLEVMQVYDRMQAAFPAVRSRPSSRSRRTT